MGNFDDSHEFDDDEIDDEIILIEDENGNEMEYFIIDSLVHKQNSYLLVTPADADDDSGDFEATIFKQIGEGADETIIYCLIDDDNEFNEIAALFMESEGDYEIEL